MNKVEIGLLISTIGIILFVGGLVYYEFADGVMNNPDIEEIGGPPVITDLRLVTIVVVVTAIVCGIVLKMKPKEDEVN